MTYRSAPQTRQVRVGMKYAWRSISLVSSASALSGYRGSSGRDVAPKRRCRPKRATAQLSLSTWRSHGRRGSGISTPAAWNWSLASVLFTDSSPARSGGRQGVQTRHPPSRRTERWLTGKIAEAISARETPRSERIRMGPLWHGTVAANHSTTASVHWRRSAGVPVGRSELDGRFLANDIARRACPLSAAG